MKNTYEHDKKVFNMRKEININKYKTEEGDVKEYQEFFVELDAKEIQTLCQLIGLTMNKGIELENLYKKLSDFDNHYDTDKTYIQHYTG